MVGMNDASCQGGTKKSTEADEQQNHRQAQSATMAAGGPWEKEKERVRRSHPQDYQGLTTEGTPDS